jgi:hypothetical protein
MDDTLTLKPDFSRVSAIALDTNIFADTPNLSTLRPLGARADAHGRIEVWIADTVVWEWAQHLHVHHRNFKIAAKKLHNAGLPIEIPDEKSASEVAEDLCRIIAGLGESIRVLDTAAFAHQAIRDQVLLEGPGKTKSDIKTGAADSAHFRAYLHEGQSRNLEFIVVSADKDARAAYRTWLGDAAPHIFNDLTKAMERIFGSVPSSADGRQLAFELAVDAETLLKDVDITGWNPAIYEYLVPENSAPLSFNVNADSAKLVGIARVKQDATALTFTAYYLADVKVSGLLETPWNWSGAITRETTLTRSVLRADISLPADSPSTSGASITSCHLTAPGTTWSDQGELLDEVLDALQLIPGIENVALDEREWNSHQRARTSELVLDVAGDQLSLSLVGSYYDNWNLTATYRGKQVTIGCQEVDGVLYDLANDDRSPRYEAVASNSDSSLLGGNGEFAINELVFGARTAPAASTQGPEAL